MTTLFIDGVDFIDLLAQTNSNRSLFIVEHSICGFLSGGMMISWEYERVMHASPRFSHQGVFKDACTWQVLEKDMEQASKIRDSGMPHIFTRTLLINY